MKNILTFLTLALIGTACQHQAPPTRAVATKPATAVAIAASAPAKVVALPTPTATADSLTPEMRSTLRQVDLSSLLLAPQPGKAGDYQSVLDGFFGKNPQRLSLAILKATRDSLQPSVYHIVGKTRYKQQIVEFIGELQIEKLADFHDQGALLTQNDDSFVQDTTAGGFPKGEILNARAYSATANFHFTSSGSTALYLLSGQAMLDFWLTNTGKIGQMYAPCEGCVDDKALAKGCGLLLRGNWVDNETHSNKPFVVSRDAFFIAANIIQDFGIGDRGAQVNPKYAKLGWNTYWENDEWWADSPKMVLSL